MPKHVDLIVGHTCNNRCIHCFMEDTRNQLKKNKLPLDKTFSQLKKLINNYADKGYETIIFTGGETTIRPDFFDLAGTVKENSMNISIQSNGRSFANEKFAKEIMLIEPNLSAIIPIHSHKKETHDMITRVNGSFRQTISGTRNLISCGCKDVTVKTVVYKPNYRDIGKIAELAKDIGAKQYNISAPQMNGNQYIDWEKMAVKHTKSTPYIKKAIDFGIETDFIVKYDAIPFCFMNRYEKYNLDIKTSIIPYIDGDNSIRESDSKENIISDLEVGRRVKTNACKKCRYINVCMGVWKEYPGIFGISEFKAIKGKIIKSAQELAKEIGVFVV